MGLCPFCSTLDLRGLNTVRYYRFEGFNFSNSECDFPANLVRFVGVFPAYLHDVVGVFPEHLVHDAFLPPVITGEAQSFLKQPWPGDYDIIVNNGLYTDPVDVLPVSNGDLQTLIDIVSVLSGDSKTLSHGYNQHQKAPWLEDFQRLMHFLHSDLKVLIGLHLGFMSGNVTRQVVFFLITTPALFHNYVGLAGTVKENNGRGKGELKTRTSLKMLLLKKQNEDMALLGSKKENFNVVDSFNKTCYLLQRECLGQMAM